MQKKIIIILLVIIFIWFAVIFIDFIMPVKYNRKPLFTFGGEKEKDGGSGLYEGLLYSITIKGNFNPEQETKINYVKLEVLFITIYTHSG